MNLLEHEKMLYLHIATTKEALCLYKEDDKITTNI